MQIEDTSRIKANSYWKQAQGEIPDEKTSSLSTRDVNKHSLSHDLIPCSVNLKKCMIFEAEFL